MRKLFPTLATSACVYLAIAGMAQAGNTYIEGKISSHSELSRFEELLEKTGVKNEMNSGVGYTVFAPTDAAFAKLEKVSKTDLDVCLESATCKGEVAKVLRNHIVPQEVSFADPGLHAVHSIDGFSISLSEPRKGDRYANGKKILEQQGSFYIIDGVIQDSQERVDLQSAVKNSVIEAENLRVQQDRQALVDAYNASAAEAAQITTPDTVVTERVYYDQNGLVDARVTTVEPARQ